MNKQTSYDRLVHYVGNHLGITFNYDAIGRPLSPEKLEEERLALAEGLKATLEHLRSGEVEEGRGIGKSQLEELLSLTEGYTWDVPGSREAVRDAYTAMLKATA